MEKKRSEPRACLRPSSHQLRKGLTGSGAARARRIGVASTRTSRMTSNAAMFRAGVPRDPAASVGLTAPLPLPRSALVSAPAPAFLVGCAGMVVNAGADNRRGPSSRRHAPTSATRTFSSSGRRSGWERRTM